MKRKKNCLFCQRQEHASAGFCVTNFLHALKKLKLFLTNFSVNCLNNILTVKVALLLLIKIFSSEADIGVANGHKMLKIYERRWITSFPYS